jgi:hypothetical protein
LTGKVARERPAFFAAAYNKNNKKKEEGRRSKKQNNQKGKGTASTNNTQTNLGTLVLREGTSMSPAELRPKFPEEPFSQRLHIVRRIRHRRGFIIPLPLQLLKVGTPKTL